VGYLHIENLYRPAAQIILLFREVYALEKVHGTSAHVAWKQGKVWYKDEALSETKTPRQVVDPAKAVMFEKAQSIADEYVTDERLRHVLDKIETGGVQVGVEATARVIARMTDDVLREGSGEFVDSREARAAIGRKTAEMFKALLRRRLESAAS